MDARKGHLVIIGGGEDTRGDCTILRHFVHLAGGRAARLAVLTAASSEGEQAGATYRQTFLRLGAEQVTVLPLSTRADANDPSACASLEDATGAFFTGGDQLRITATLGGTALLRALYRLHERGAVLAGTSAGAAAMSATMIVGGRGDDTVRRDVLSMSPGLGFLAGAVIDQHFAQRGRINRLLAAISQNPEILGIGIDEDTAVVIAGASASVLGAGTVTVLDGSQLAHTNASESRAGDPLALMDVVVHVLPEQYRFDLLTRRPLPPA
jgi:cyanophycinase